jgi:LGFP repeat
MFARAAIGGLLSMVLAGVAFLVTLPPSAEALSGSAFNPGLIISDSNFYDSNAMSESQIQSFLNAKCAGGNCLNVVLSPSTTRVPTNMCPGTYTGAASETSAAILYKVQRACGISAKVLLVTLQKEQGLVTLANPSAAKLQKAMGYACPDTSVCDSQFYGFFNQVYSAASQFKRYGLRTADNVSFRTKFQIGIPYPIQYNPNPSCGTLSVTVQNKATTALYYYTPYTPNGPALANLSGVGDSCSAYGNRNFWVYYNNWFGDPTTVDGAYAINDAYATTGGASGPLGAPTATLVCPPGSSPCWQGFVGGYITWMQGDAAHVSSGSIGALYKTLGGPTGSLGYARSDMVSVADNGGGVAQAFDGGLINAGPSGAFVESGSIRNKHSELGSVAGPYGWPTSAMVCGLQGNGCFQQFQHGTIVTSDLYPTLGVSGNMATLYASLGGPGGVLGLPTSVMVSASGNGGGFAQAFENGLVNASSAGAFAEVGAIRAKHSSMGSVAGPLGWPIGAAVCTLPGGGCSQEFQGGMIFASNSGLVQGITDPAIKTLYVSLGGPGGSLGWPVSDTASSTANGGGHAQAFENGLINAGSPGAFVESGVIRTKHSALGSVAGSYGWPTAAAVCGTPAGTCSQQFQGGTISSP